MKKRILLAVAMLSLLAPAARADRGALTLEGGGAPMMLWVPPRDVDGVTRAPDAGATVAVRYAWTHWLEVFVRGEWAPPLPAVAEGVAVHRDNGSAPLTGQLRWVTSGTSVVGGLRFVRGLVLRTWVEVELGYGRWSLAAQQLVDVTTPGGPYDYGLSLPDVLLQGLRAGAGVGVDWAFDDRWTVGISLRAGAVFSERWMGGVLLPITLSYSFYP